MVGDVLLSAPTRAPAPVAGRARPGFWVVSVYGEIDLVNADELCQGLLELARRVPYRAIVDCAGVSFIDVAGCRGLLAAHARATAVGSALRIVAPEGSPLRRLLALADPEGRTPLYASVEQAARAPRPASPPGQG